MSGDEGHMQGETQLLDNISFQPSVRSLQRTLRVAEDSPYRDELETVLCQAEAVAQPKALYRVAYVHDTGDDYIALDRVRLTSRVLRVNLDGLHRVFLYVATCGVELEAWSQTLDDVLHQYWADAIKQSAVGVAGQALRKEIKERYQLDNVGTMAPGSLGDWPITEQRQLFRLMGDTERIVGVRLSESCLMIPSKSVSGLLFPTETHWENCMLCPRQSCPGRRAPFDPDLYEKRFRPSDAAEPMNQQKPKADAMRESD
jgi:hypothetical protein